MNKRYQTKQTNNKILILDTQDNIISTGDSYYNILSDNIMVHYGLNRLFLNTSKELKITGIVTDDVVKAVIDYVKIREFTDLLTPYELVEDALNAGA